MEVSQLTIRIVVLLLPGIISMQLYRTLVNKSEIDNRDYFMQLIINSFLSYFILLLIINFNEFIKEGYKNFTFQHITFFQALIHENINISMQEVLYSCLSSIFIGIMMAFLYNKKIIYSFFKKIKITDKDGPEDVWMHFLNKNGKGITDRIKVILDNKIIYEGKVVNHSEYASFPELVLEDVNIYELFNPKKENSYHKDEVYLKIDNRNIIIEVGENSNE